MRGGTEVQNCLLNQYLNTNTPTPPTDLHWVSAKIKKAFALRNLSYHYTSGTYSASSPLLYACVCKTKSRVTVSLGFVTYPCLFLVTKAKEAPSIWSQKATLGPKTVTKWWN